MNKQIALEFLNKAKQQYLESKSSNDILLSNLYCGKYIGMALAYYQCSIISAEEHSKLLEEI